MAIPPDTIPGTGAPDAGADSTLLPGLRSLYGDRVGGASDADILAAARQRRGIGAGVSDAQLAEQLEAAARAQQRRSASDLSPDSLRGVPGTVAKAARKVEAAADSTGVALPVVSAVDADKPGLLATIFTWRTAPARGALNATAGIVQGLDAAPLPLEMRGLPLEAQQKLLEGRAEIQRRSIEASRRGETLPSQVAGLLRRGSDALYADERVQEGVVDETLTGLGSALPYIGAGVVSGPLSPFVMATLGVAGKSGALLQESEQQGDTAEQTRKRLGYSLAGTAEALPLERALGRLALQPLKRRAVNIALGALEEASQEAFDQVTQNIALGRDLWDGVQHSAEAGGRVGLILNALTTYLGGKGVRRRGEPGSQDSQGDGFPTEPIPGTPDVQQTPDVAVGQTVRFDADGNRTVAPSTPDPAPVEDAEAGPQPETVPPEPVAAEEPVGADEGAAAADGAAPPLADQAELDEDAAFYAESLAELKQEIAEEGLDVGDLLYDRDPSGYIDPAKVVSPFFGRVSEFGGVVVHQTTVAPETIAAEGLVAGNKTRGLRNRSVGNAVFAAAEYDPSESYGPVTVEIDVGALRADQGTEVGLEPAVEEYYLREALAAEIDAEEALFGYEGASTGETETTLIIFDDVPPEYIRVLNEDGDEVHVGARFGKQARDPVEAPDASQDAPAPVAPVDAPAEAGGPTEAAEQADEDPVFRQRIEDVNERRAARGLPPGTRKDSANFADAIEQATARPNPEARAPVDDALDLADRILTTDYAATRVDRAALFVREEQLDAALTDATAEVNRLIDEGAPPAQITDARERQAKVRAEYDIVSNAQTRVGSQAGEALAERARALNRNTYTLASVRRVYRAEKGADLTPAEEQRIERFVAQNDAAEARAAQMAELSDAAEAQKAADAALKVAKRAATQKVKREGIDAERADAKAKLAALGMQVNSFTGLPVEAALQVGRLAKTYLQEGAQTLKGRALLDDAVAKVRRDVPELNERQVWAALQATDPKAKKKAEDAAKKELKRRQREAETQARLLNDIGTILDGGTVQGRPRPLTTAEVRTLQKRLRRLKLEATKGSRDAEKLARVMTRIEEAELALENGYRAMKRGRTAEESPELQEARQKLRDVNNEMRAEDRLAVYRDDLRTGNLAPYMQAAARRQVPAEVERARTLAYAARKKIDRIVKEAKPPPSFFGPTIWEATKERILSPTVNFFRTAKATVDISYLARQGGMLGIRGAFTDVPPSLRDIAGEGKVTKQALVNSLSSFGSEQHAQDIMRQIEEHPNNWMWRRAELYIGDMDAAPGAREENFQSNAAEAVGGAVGRGAAAVLRLGGVNVDGENLNAVRGSERNMTIGLNIQRIASFEGFMQRHPDATVEQQKAWADFVNKGSGRGDLGSFTQAANFLSLGIFAPRFAVSRVQAPWMLIKHMRDPVLRKEIATDVGAFYGTAVAATGLIAFAATMFFDEDDVEVGLDPYSSDFGKLIVGNTRTDLFAGFLQPFRFGVRLGFSIKDALPGQEEDPRYDPVDSALTTFGRYKASPLVSTGNTLITGRTIVGQEVSRAEALARSVIPLTIEEAFDAYHAYDDPMQQIGAALYTAAGSGTGIGVSTYDNPLKAAGVGSHLARSGYTPRPSNALREYDGGEEAFNREMADIIRDNRDRLKSLDGENLKATLKAHRAVANARALNEVAKAK